MSTPSEMIIVAFFLLFSYSTVKTFLRYGFQPLSLLAMAMLTALSIFIVGPGICYATEWVQDYWIAVLFSLGVYMLISSLFLYGSFHEQKTKR